jgi:hypothetical protein
MSNVHLILQGKGGVGKSLVAVMIAQYLKSLGRPVICADTDPVNATFTQYKSLDVAHVDIAKDGTIIQTKFDPMMETIIGTDSDFVVDNGAATFLPLTKYLVDNDIYKILEECGKKVFIHSVVTGGQAKSDTFNGFTELANKISGSAKIVVWENEFWGPVEYDGHSILATRVYKEADRAGKIAGRVKIVDRSSNDAFVDAVKAMTSAHMTFEDVKAAPEFGLLVKNRLDKIIGDIFAEMRAVGW